MSRLFRRLLVVATMLCLGADVIAATYATDFSEYATGTAPSDWAEQWHDLSDFSIRELSGTISGKVLQLSNRTGDNLQFLAWLTPGTAETMEVLTCSRANSTDTGIDYAYGPVLFGSGTSTSETGLLVNYTTKTGGYGRVMRYSGASANYSQVVGTASDGDATPCPSHAYTDWLWTRSSWASGVWRVKVWKGLPADEPIKWNHVKNGLVALPAGYAGVFRFDGVADQFQWFSVGTNGDPAPSLAIGCGLEYLCGNNLFSTIFKTKEGLNLNRPQKIPHSKVWLR